IRAPNAYIDDLGLAGNFARFKIASLHAVSHDSGNITGCSSESRQYCKKPVDQEFSAYALIRARWGSPLVGRKSIFLWFLRGLPGTLGRGRRVCTLVERLELS